MSDLGLLHEQLIDKLTADGHLRTEPWKRAAQAVPRHEFLRDGYFRRVDRGGPTAWTPVLEDDPGWMEGCYADESLVTQIAGTIVPADVRGEILREPTSSSTLPSLVLRMLEELRVEPGMKVLEVGTGTGYSTAVLSARLGEQRVTSIEYDSEVAGRARAALSRLGMYPNLVTGDGLLGVPEGAPYHRIIATCGVREVPAAWIEQTRPGGKILATLGGWMHASELARLTVADDGTASGPLLGGRVSFMLARPHLPAPLGVLPDFGSGVEREAVVGADVLADWTFRFMAQFALPSALRLTLHQNGYEQEVLVDVGTGSWAALHEEHGRWIVRQDGPDLLWDIVEDHHARWRTAGAPALEEMMVHLTPEGLTFRW